MASMGLLAVEAPIVGIELLALLLSQFGPAGCCVGQAVAAWGRGA